MRHESQTALARARTTVRALVTTLILAGFTAIPGVAFAVPAPVSGGGASLVHSESYAEWRAAAPTRPVRPARSLPGETPAAGEGSGGPTAGTHSRARLLALRLWDLAASALGVTEAGVVQGAGLLPEANPPLPAPPDFASLTRLVLATPASPPRDGPRGRAPPLHTGF
ncbi:hypothetical protein [Rhizohabitans arisaemae]|uniref:hypothetical protein n=1 Tax=Rhizohabitans arisaemae TaxID=2720610 RepID=UPI0024B0D0EF|nr:hypothetical protein [Rhizohabitans arisaemae]